MLLSFYIKIVSRFLSFKLRNLVSGTLWEKLSHLERGVIGLWQRLCFQTRHPGEWRLCIHSCKTLLYNVSVLTLCEAFLLRSGGTRFPVKNSGESTIHSVFASLIYLCVGSPISLGNGHSPQVLMRQDLSLLKRSLKIERLWAMYTRVSYPLELTCSWVKIVHIPYPLQ